MIVSRNELSSQILKACLGAGLYRGNAEDFAAAFGRVGSVAASDVGLLAAALEAHLGDGQKSGSTRRALIDGPSAVDAFVIDPSRPMQRDEFDHPRLVDLLLAAAANSGEATAFALEIEQSDWNRLRRFARRLLVKADGASRLADAGAGLNDND